MRAVIVGAVESTRVTLNALTAAGWDIAGLVTLPPELAHRHSDFCDLTAEARDRGAQVIHAGNGNAPEIIVAAAALKPDYCFVIGWSQICGPAFREAMGHRVIGYHPAPLPRLRGRAVIPWTILLDEKITASTLFWIDDGVDSGPILAQRFFHVASDETAATLYARHMEALGAMLADNLPLLATGKAPRLVQEERFASWAAKRTPADGIIDWSRPSADILRLIRAVGRPYPGAFTTIDGERLVIWQAEHWPQGFRHAALPGQIVETSVTGFSVACGDGNALRITEHEGTAPMRLHAMLGRENG